MCKQMDKFRRLENTKKGTMKTEKVKATITLDRKDYMHVSSESGQFTITICDRSKCPVHIKLDRLQLFKLLNSGNTALAHEQEQLFETLNFDKAVDDVVQAIAAVQV